MNKQTYRIGVISDTHDKWVPLVEKLFQGVDEIWHLGDVCQEPILDSLRLICPKLSVVLGNNDLSLDSPMTLNLERNGERFHLIHIIPREMPPKADWLLFGHTHVGLDEMRGKLHLFNPGSSGRANKGAPASVGFLTCEPGKKFRSEIVLL